MEDRRKHKREILFFYTRVFDRTDGKLLGHLCDITPTGAMVISDKPIPADRVYPLSVELPMKACKRDRMNIEAQAVWTKPDLDPEFSNTGFKFLDISPEQVKTIQALVEEYRLKREALSKTE